MSESQSSQKNNYTIDIIMYVILALSLFLSFIFDTLLIYVAAFFGEILVDYLLKAKRKKAAPPLVPDVELTEEKLKDLKRELLINRILGGLIIISFIVSFAIGDIYTFLIATLIAFIFTYVRVKNEKEEDKILAKRHAGRWEWVDQFRGLVVIFLIIAGVTWKLSGGHDENGVGDPLNPPIGPTYLNHGWKFAEFAGWPNIITIIDIGQQILMFIVGFVGTLAYYKHLQREGEVGAYLHIIRRFSTLMFFGILVEHLFGGEVTISDWHDVVSVFWTGTFPNLAWGSLVSLTLVAIMKHKPDQRFIVAMVIFLIYSIMYHIPALREWEWVVNGQQLFKIPWNTINHVSIAILGTTTYDWFAQYKDEDPAKGWKERILPVGSLLFILTYLVDFVEPAEHHDATTALSMMAVATSMFILFLFYSFSQLDFKIPQLNTMGKNILIMFLLTGFWGDVFFKAIDKQIMIDNPWLALIYAGVIPILVQWMAAWVLEKNNIIIKF